MHHGLPSQLVPSIVWSAKTYLPFCLNLKTSSNGKSITCLDGLLHYGLLFLRMCMLQNDPFSKCPKFQEWGPGLVNSSWVCHVWKLRTVMMWRDISRLLKLGVCVITVSQNEWLCCHSYIYIYMYKAWNYGLVTNRKRKAIPTFRVTGFNLHSLQFPSIVL